MGRLSRLLQECQRARGAAVVGVLNVTPDSFYDGGRWLAPEAVLARLDQLVAEGADLLDIGAESSRPGASPVPAEEQWRRAEFAVREAVARGVPVSIDTTCPEVADRALSAGAVVVNDVSCLANSDLARVVARHGAGLILMHSRGPMSSMTGFSKVPEGAYADVVHEVLEEWGEARERALAAGVAAEQLVLDPGLGFWKSAAHSFELLRRLPELRRAGAPVLVGPSRKSFIAAVDPVPPDERLPGTLASVVLAVERGAAAVRVHDVHAVRQALAVLAAVRGSVAA